MATSDDFHVEIKRIRKEDNIQTTQKLEFCDVDELVHNPGLQHVALYIFNLMDLFTLKTCRAISKSWKRMIDNDKHWWRLLLFKCTEINAGTRNFRPVIFTGSFEDPNIFVGPSFQVAMKPLNQLHPMFVDTFAYICDMETLETVEMFTKFMIDYFKTLKVKNLGSPLHYASSLKRLDIFEVMSRTPILDLNLEVDGGISDANMSWSSRMENQNLPPHDVSKDVLQYPFEKDRQSLNIGPEKDL